MKNKCMIFRIIPAITSPIQMQNSGLIKHGFILIYIMTGIYIRKKGDLFDEAAKQSLQKTEI